MILQVSSSVQLATVVFIFPEEFSRNCYVLPGSLEMSFAAFDRI